MARRGSTLQWIVIIAIAAGMSHPSTAYLSTPRPCTAAHTCLFLWRFGNHQPLEHTDRAFEIAGGALSFSEPAGKVTVLITSYSVEGFRPLWLRTILEFYAAPTMEDLVHKVILVWNNEEEPPPLVDGVLVMRCTNSLNNRWNKTIEHIETEVVLNLDDDILIKRNGLLCLMQQWRAHPEQLVGPFIRKHKGLAYVFKEIGWKNAVPYSILLPRIMLLKREYLVAYRDQIPWDVKRYIDEQEGHCDDILMNALVANTTGLPPLRVIPPRHSVVDFFESCFEKLPEQTGGLTLAVARGKLRSECLKHLVQHFDEDGKVLKFSQRVVVCQTSKQFCTNCSMSAAEAFYDMRAHYKCAPSRLLLQ